MPTGICPLCEAAEPEPFYRVQNVPTNSCLLVASEEAARACGRGDIELAFCAACGFVHNRAFELARTEYSERYQSSQGCSATFGEFERALALRIGAHFGLQGGRAVEVGCGDGRFLETLVEMLGLDQGIGVDPAAPVSEPSDRRVRFIRQPLSPAIADELDADLVICKMTLEHVPDIAGFTSTLARLAGTRPDGGLFLSVPAGERVFATTAYWDVYYEHCNYFGENALLHLLRTHGLGDVALRAEFGGHYLTALARRGCGAEPPSGTGVSALAEDIAGFAPAVELAVARWDDLLARRRARGATTVLWGSGSKAVAFLCALPHPDQIEAVVDINPARQGQFVAGTGHPIVAPEALETLRPDHVIVMNPNYETEIRRSLALLGLTAELAALN